MAGKAQKSGGRRAGAGRKPKAFTTLKKRIESEQTADADYAFSLYAGVMRDPEQPIILRLDCANWVSNRVLGLPKAKTETEHSGSIGLNVGHIDIVIHDNSDGAPVSAPDHDGAKP